MSQKIVLSVFLTLTLALSLPAWTLAQCGGGDHYGMHGQQTGSSGPMGSGQMGRYSGQSAPQPNPNSASPGYVSPVPPPATGYTLPQDSGGYGQMTGPGGATSGHSGHQH